MKNKFKAVTLVETLITLLAISFMIAGPIFFVSRSFSYAGYVQQKIIATGLAQEGLELATSLRNNSTTTFTTQMDANCAGNCAIDWNGESDTPTLFSCDPSTNNCRLNLVNINGAETFRALGAGEQSPYLRALSVEKNDTLQSYTVTSRVWSKEDATFIVDVKLKKILYAN
jgi:hypothetical protein